MEEDGRGWKRSKVRQGGPFGLFRLLCFPRLKVSEIEADGCVPLSQTRFAKRGVAESVPVVDMDRYGAVSNK